jgi:hypothetical protein
VVSDYSLFRSSLPLPPSPVVSTDGQYQRAQNYFREVSSSESDEDSNCVIGTVKVLKVLLEDIPYVDNFIDDSVIYVLEAAGQAFDTLNDMIQVPTVSLTPLRPHCLSLSLWNPRARISRIKRS